MKSRVIPNPYILFIVVSLLVLIIPAAYAEEEMPSMEFLEYLGEWETKEGQWVDPTVLAEEQSLENVEIELVYTIEEQQDE
ncbi:MAG: hypothetical protein ACC707_04115 [Thiohalomonadales bacterium]